MVIKVETNFKIMFKRFKACTFDPAKLLKKWGYSQKELLELAQHYRFCTEAIEAYFVPKEKAFYIGNALARKALHSAVKQRRLVYLSGKAGTGKTYYANAEFGESHDIISPDLSETRIRDLFETVQYTSILKPRLLVIDAIDKITKPLAKDLLTLQEKTHIAVIVITQLPESEIVKKVQSTTKSPVDVSVISFEEVSSRERELVLKYYFPEVADAFIEKVAKKLPLKNGIQFIQDGTSSADKEIHLSSKDICGNILMNEDRDKVFQLLQEQQPNTLTVCIYLAEQKLTPHNREVVTDHLQYYVHNIPEEYQYMVMAYGIVPQKVAIKSPDTISRRKWAMTPETVPVKAAKAPVTIEKKQKPPPKSFAW